MKHDREAFDHLVQVKAPKSFAEALNKAASDCLMSRSDFVRTTLADRLRAMALMSQHLSAADGNNPYPQDATIAAKSS